MHKKGGSSICYAESRDGLKWELADLPDDTDRHTAVYKNAVFSGDVRVSQGAVTYDPYDTDPSRRYKLAYAEEVETMHLAYSPDGIKWRIDPGPSWTPIASETENHINYNPFTGRYQIICRAATVDRRIAMVESEDLVNWTEPRIILHPSPLDPVGLQFYGMPTLMYEDIFLGFLWKFQTGTTNKGGLRRNDGVIEPELTYSYDGLTWNRTHRSLIERSARGPYYGGRIYLENLVIDHEGDIRLYSRGAYSEHGTQGTFGKSVLVLHKLRRDGFVGLESVGREGYLKTKPFVLKGDELSLNVQAWNGSVRVQISDEKSKPYTGFSFDDCVEWTGDDVFHRPRWNGKDDLSELGGKIVRFEIKLKEGILYAIRAQLNPAHCKPPRLRY
jgi:hypothetical protein